MTYYDFAPLLDVNTLFPFKVPRELTAGIRSLNASLDSQFTSPLDNLDVADAVHAQAIEDARIRRAVFDKADKADTETFKTFEGKRFGVYVNGKLKFQSRNEDEIRRYADDKMRDFRNNVWLAPVGSFVTV
jgi:hypothetical protein